MLESAAKSFRQGAISRDALAALVQGVSATLETPAPADLDASFGGQLDGARPSAKHPETPFDVSSDDDRDREDDGDTIGTGGTRAFVQSLEQIQQQLGALIQQRA
jgi:hypothetical protein